MILQIKLKSVPLLTDSDFDSQRFKRFENIFRLRLKNSIQKEQSKINNPQKKRSKGLKEFEEKSDFKDIENFEYDEDYKYDVEEVQYTILITVGSINRDLIKLIETFLAKSLLKNS